MQRRYFLSFGCAALAVPAASSAQECVYRPDPFAQPYVNDARLRNFQSCRRSAVQKEALDLPPDHFGHKGWRKRYIALKGDRRIVFETDFGMAPQTATVRFAAYRIVDFTPFETRVWVTWNGINRVLLPKSSFGSFDYTIKPGINRIKAWASKTSSVVYYLDW